jgi:hypothetical protein
MESLMLVEPLTRTAILSALAMTGLTVAPAKADGIKVGHSLEVIQTLATGFSDGDADFAKLEIRPEIDLRFNRAWRADVALRIEGATGDTGLGSMDAYGDLSRPLRLGPDARIEVDEATLSWRKHSTRITLGKQSLAWGVLDGLQVTDRFDAVRRREAVFTDQRPERISRWGARAEFNWADVRWDLATSFDGTSDQPANLGDTFAVRAPRFRAGLPAGSALPEIEVDTPDDPTFGIRGTKRIGASDFGTLVIHGPDTEPVFRPSGTGVALEYNTRTLVGATWQTSAGARVWRVETAWVPDQPVNLEGTTLATDTRSRWLAGAGLDWDLPNDLFMNAQLGVDHVEGDGLVRPNTDIISTLKIQRSFANQTWNVSAELLGSLSNGDGTFRPALSWQVSDRLRLQSGMDLVWGNKDGIFGQFRDTDRAWLKVRWMV